MVSASAITLNDLELQRFFFALVLLLGSVHLCGYFLQCWKMPRVIGEIVGGLVLGPTVLGFFWPEGYAWVFQASAVQPKLLSSIYWFGLVLLMFVSGFEIQKSITKEDGRIIVAILLGGTLLPFLVGCLAPTFLDVSGLIGDKGNLFAFQLVMGTAVAVTSIPVLSKIFFDLNLSQTRFAKIVLATATIEDLVLWTLMLPLATGVLTTGEVSLWSIGFTVLLSLTFFAVGLLLLPKLMRIGNASSANFLMKSSASGYVFFLCFFFVALAGFLSVNLVFGALVGGIVVGLMPEERFEKVRAQIKEVALGLFVPLYFGIVGLKLDLIHHFAFLPFLGFFVFACLVKISATFLTAKLTRLDSLSSFNLALAMNTRGGPGIVLATVAFELGIISESFFIILVLVAILTSLSAGYWFTFLTTHGWCLWREQTRTGEEAAAAEMAAATSN